MRRPTLVLLASFLVNAAVAQDLVTIDTRKDWNGNVVSIDYALWPSSSAPKAVVVVIPGGNSNPRFIRNAGEFSHGELINPIMIGQKEFGARGIALALMGLPSDRPGGADRNFRSDPSHAEDIASVAADALKRTRAQRAYVVGIGSGGVSAFFAGRQLVGRIHGVVGVGVTVGLMRTFDFSRMKTPALIVYGAEGRCDLIPFADVQEIARVNNFSFLPVWGPLEELGKNPCALGTASFLVGRERLVADAVADWIAGKPLPDLMEGKPVKPLLNERVVFVSHHKAVGAPKLETTLYSPDGDGRFPLVVMSHGIPYDKNEMRKQQVRFRWVRQAEEFVKRGFVVAIPMRRGYGRSEGTENQARAKHPDPGLEDALDVEAVVQGLAAFPNVDTNRVIALGQSGGGLASLSLAAKNPHWLKGVINFAGGLKDSDASQDWEGPLVREFSRLGATNVPSLWIYSENDSFFGPTLVRDMHTAYTKAGGQAMLHQLGPFGRDGHAFWGAAETIPRWWPHVDAFLKERGLLK